MVGMSENTSPGTTADQGFDKALTDVLNSMAKAAADGRHASASYKAMAAWDSIERLVRHVEFETTNVILDAYDVLTGKFGLEDKRPLYDYLFEVPMRFRLYREAFNAETHVGCVDRAVAKVADEIRTAGNADIHKSNQRFDKAGLAGDGNGGTIGPVVAADALILAERFDDSRRIQRLSNDTRAIVERIIASGTNVDAAALAGTVRLILGTAADIAHEKDGLDMS